MYLIALLSLPTNAGLATNTATPRVLVFEELQPQAAVPVPPTPSNHDGSAHADEGPAKIGALDGFATGAFASRGC
jgi:hypothetical protein